MTDDLAIDIVDSIKVSHKWLLENVLAKNVDLDLNTENYSDELKHSIITQELLEMM